MVRVKDSLADNAISSDQVAQGVLMTPEWMQPLSGLKVLLVEDDENDYFIIRSLLSSISESDARTTAQLTWKSEFAGALDALGQETFDLIIVDYVLPPHTGIEFLNAVRDRGIEIPIIILTGRSDFKVDLEAMRRGAADFLDKNELTAALLERSMRFAVDRYQVQQERREASMLARFHAHLLDSVGEAVIALDSTGAVIHLNAAAEKLYGYTASEALGRDILGLIGQTPVTKTGKKFYEACLEGRRWSGDVTVRRPDGSKYIAHLSSEPFSDASGRALGWVVVSFDVTDRVVTQQALKRQALAQRKLLQRLAREKERLDASQRFAKLGSWEMEFSPNRIYLSPEAFQILGLESGKASDPPPSYLDSVHPDDREEVRQEFQQALKLRSHFEIDHRVRLPDGSEKFVSSQATIRFNRQGQPVRAAGIIQDISQRKKSESEFTNLQKSYALLLDSVGEGIHGIDLNGLGTFDNRVGAEMLGLKRGELVGRDVHHLIHHSHTDGSTYARSECPIWATVTDGQTRRVDDEVFWRADGTSLPVEYTCAPIIGPNEKPDGAVVVFRDISERKRTEQALKESERNLSNAQRLANIGSWLFDLETRTYTLSDQLYRILGFSPDLSKPSVEDCKERVLVDDRGHFLSTEAVGEQIDRPVSAEIRVQLPQGETRYLSARTQALLSADKQLLGLEGTIEDITERKLAQLERDRFLSVSRDLLCIISREGKFVRVNDAFCDILGLTVNELNSRQFLALVHPEDREATKLEAQNIVEGKVSSGFVNRYRCKDSSYRTLLWTAKSFDDALYGLATDITSLREAQEEFRLSNAALEQRVEKRTRELEESNKQLQVAKDVADRANRAKSEFLSRMSHELRTPLNSIMGFAQILAGQKLSGLGRESLHYIQQSSRHLLTLINEILDLASVEAGRIPISLEPVEVSQIMEEACNLVRPLAEQYGVKLRNSDRCLGSCWVRADQNRLKQVMINVITNGVKYNVYGGSVELSWFKQPDGLIRIEVADTGVGISSNDMPKLFTSFERLHAANSDIEGTGLGLVLSNHFVSLMEGRIEVESREGVGSKFAVLLFESESPIEEYVRDAPSQALFGASETRAEVVTVLCIEDNPANLSLLRAVFRQEAGYAMLDAVQGGIGLDLATHHLPDLILLDLNLPDISGIEVLAKVRSHPATRAIPVIVVSADATRAQIKRVMAAGANAYVTKPLDVALLLDTAQRLISERASSTDVGMGNDGDRLPE